MMSELPIVLSSGRPRLRNLTGLNGSIRPGPQSGRESLVERVDVVCGPAPTAATGPRTLLSSAGCFDLADGRWRARWLTPGGADQVAEVTAFPIEIPGGIEVREAPAEATLAALAAVDPDGARRAEFGE